MSPARPAPETSAPFSQLSAVGRAWEARNSDAGKGTVGRTVTSAMVDRGDIRNWLGGVRVLHSEGAPHPGSNCIAGKAQNLNPAARPAHSILALRLRGCPAPC